nr:Rieske 2Fe-2S domain-containing protein [Mesorhizobium sp.]
MGEKTFICRVDEIEAGTPVIAKVRSLSVGVFRIGESFHALLNICPHRGAPSVRGRNAGRPRRSRMRGSSIIEKTRSCAAPGTAGSSTSRRVPHSSTQLCVREHSRSQLRTATFM